MIANYILQGRLNEAFALFEHILSIANDVALFAEEIDPETGELLGNFPQAFTAHRLIDSAIRLPAAESGKMPEPLAIVEQPAHISP